MTAHDEEAAASIGSLFDSLCERHEGLTLARSAATGISFEFAGLKNLSGNLFGQIMRDGTPLVTGRVALIVKSPYLFTLLYLSLLRLNLAVIPINPALPREAMTRVLASANADCVVTDVKMDIGASRTLFISEESVAELAVKCDSDFLQARNRSGGASVILFTSGTTSSPKGVVLGWRGLVANAQHIAERLTVKQSRLLGVLPLHHTNGQVFNILIPFLTGSTIYCNSDYSMMSLGTFWSSIEQHRIGFVDVVPTVLITLLELPPSRPPDVSSLRYMICGGSPVAIETLREFQEKFGVRILQEYGLTEATCVSAMEGPGAQRLGTVGLPLRGNAIAVRKQDQSPCRPGERGEVCIRGEYLMQGYLNPADAGCVVDPEGWLATGDLGVLDADGYLSIVGRSKTVIVKAGETIVPEDIENAAHHCPWVRDAVALGVADSFYGEAIELHVVWSDGVPHELELTECLRLELPRTWLPNRIKSVTVVPRSVSGKIMRDKAKSLIAEE